MDDQHNKNNSLVNLSLLFLSLWILFSAWQTQQLVKQNIVLTNKVHSLPSSISQQDLIINQAILTAFAEYRLRHDLKTTNYWLTVALKNTHTGTNPACIKMLTTLVSQTQNSAIPASVKQAVLQRLSAIIASIADQRSAAQASSVRQLATEHSLSSMFKLPSINNDNIFAKLAHLLATSKEHLVTTNNIKQVEFNIEKAMDLIIKIQAAHPAEGAQALSIYTQLKAIKKQLYHQPIVIEALAYCNTQNSLVTVSNFSQKKFKRQTSDSSANFLNLSV